ncbi:ATP-binding protein [Thermomonospora amylolytica]|uniref:ATP-binding protein n=1 Tax=Thermomonospora amylolytica TaxID=1411117 RepID=UPI000E6CFC03|nr:ATP-binding protein [Thermomonospora amylolytica]
MRTPAPPDEENRIHATFTLAPDDRAPAGARERVARELRGWGLARLADDALTVVSELVTNAVRYGAAHITVNVEWHRTREAVEIAVWDDAPGTPQRREPDFVSETGRGLHIVERLSTGWGHRPGTGGVGKTVWAELR